MKLYHVSVDLDHDGKFIPDIPEGIEDGDSEDNTIPRICFSNSISGCLGSIPDGGKGLEKYIKSGPDNKYFKVFILDTNKYDLRILPPLEIADKVPDALVHNEYWVLDEVTIEDFMYIEVISFKCDKETDKITDLVVSALAE